jgi:hypothetical protein
MSILYISYTVLLVVLQFYSIEFEQNGYVHCFLKWMHVKNHKTHSQKYIYVHEGHHLNKGAPCFAVENMPLSIFCKKYKIL